MPLDPAQIHQSALPASLRRVTKRYEVVVCGGGMAGVGAAVTAARHGARVALVQDRPVLGGNGSKEVRVWLQGASGGANNLWFRETGLMEELLLENQYRNPEGNAELWDTVLLELVLGTPNLDLYLNTTLLEVAVEEGRIARASAATLHAETITVFEAPYFIDCTGDGTLGYLAGAQYTTGREARSEFGEGLAPERREANTLGGSILIWTKDAGHPVPFVPPAFALKLTRKDFRLNRDPVRDLESKGCGFWWAEWGGTLDTIHDNEAIKFELLKIVYGIFDYLKNDPEVGGKFAHRTLEWVGAIPGKRESRRLLGDHILTQQDVDERTEFPDAVAYGGWNLDDHARLGFFDEVEPPASHTDHPGIFHIPLRCLYSRNVPNLLFSGRNASVTHVALTSVRVMLTCAQMGEAAGAAAAQCLREGVTPRELAADPVRLARLQQRLLRDDHYIINRRMEDPADLCLRPGVRASASSQQASVSTEQVQRSYPLTSDRLVLFPAHRGALEEVEVLLSARVGTRLGWQLHQADGRGRYLPVRTLAEGSVEVPAGGTQWVRLRLGATLEADDWVFLELKKNPDLEWLGASKRMVGLRSFVDCGTRPRHWINSWSRFHKLSQRENYCLRVPADERTFGPANAVNGWPRPFRSPNLWCSGETGFAQPEWLEVGFEGPAAVTELELLFDSDLDRHLVNTWLQAPHRVEPDLVRDYDLELRSNGRWQTVLEVRGNRQRLRRHRLPEPVRADALRVVVRATHGTPQARIYQVRAF